MQEIRMMKEYLGLSGFQNLISPSCNMAASVLRMNNLCGFGKISQDAQSPLEAWPALAASRFVSLSGLPSFTTMGKIRTKLLLGKSGLQTKLLEDVILSEFKAGCKTTTNMWQRNTSF